MGFEIWDLLKSLWDLVFARRWDLSASFGIWDFADLWDLLLLHLGWRLWALGFGVWDLREIPWDL